MKPNSMIAIADAVNHRRRTTAALSHLVSLLDQAGRSGSPDIDESYTARAALLELFVEKMRANDELLANLVRDATPNINRL